MAATNLITTGNTDASSSDVTLAAGDVVTVALKDAEPGALVHIELKDDGGAYQSRGILSPAGNNDLVQITGPGTYRFRRPGGKNCGVFLA